ncbi:type 2 lantipeptide synthetase LanM [Streptomyces sp. R302]|uniref:type 2 lanthipeptide synthetase LanM family protein n=1 Tax=unclassified Streptomyces TaxID=2593676 RepID=UPI00145F2CE2|nr:MULTISPECIES: type 2 lanthipeptide synthetase LanM family protein [unclassified Streptomyces]NML51041.1 type 2 lantipeptide synthetase LanM [Streptomyces sp. R301]NML81135.1 type 2 lantipeptide synthetase LanM [Streptomyces sp. R302]
MAAGEKRGGGDGAGFAPERHDRSERAEGGERGAGRLSFGDERWWRRGTVAVPEGGDGRYAESAAAGAPDWAEFALGAVGAAPEEAAVPEGELPGLSGFERVVGAFAERAGERLVAGVPEGVRGRVDLGAVRADLERHLRRRLARAAARTLVLELHEARRAGRLDGADSRARYRDFVRRAGTREGLTELLAGRPVLARILSRAGMDAADALGEMLGRLVEDLPVVSERLLGGDPGRLAGVEPGAGDGHGGGRSVMLLQFEGGARLVYKPRPISVHRHFNELVAWFNGLPDAVELRTLRLLDRGRYGWVEFVEARGCAESAEVEAFYRRQGVLLSLLHVLDGTDLHHENLIAVGGHPVLVDLETLFHPPLTGAVAEDPASRALQDSVYRVGLLPQLLVGDDSALDVSGVGGGRQAPSPVVRADWADAGTDTMHLVRRAGTMGESANLPRLRGEFAEPGAHVEAMCAGFRAGYTAISRARDELLLPGGPLDSFVDDEVRVVARPTWVYTMLLDESTHPDLLGDAAARHRILETLRTDELGAAAFPGLEDDELAQLWAGDVPLFTARPGGTRLHGSGGRPTAVATERPGLARVRERIAALDTVDRQDQEWIVRAAMVTSSRAPAHRPPGSRRARTADYAPEPERLLSAARSIGDQLVSQAYRGAGRTNWIGLELLDERYWRIGPMAADLAGGYTGPALFLAQLAALTGAGHYAEAARTALAPVPGLLDALHEHPDNLAVVGSGAFSGLGGIAYALAETARLLDDPEVGEWVAPALRLTGAAALSEHEHGYGSGTAGGLVALLAGHRAVGGTETWRTARACADRLVELLAAGRLRGRPDVATGLAGAGWALLRFAEAGGGNHARRAGLAALREAVGGDPAGRSGAWCRGRAGIALAVLDGAGALDDPLLARWARETVDVVARGGPSGDDSLCHGESGLLELLGHGALPEARPHWVRRAGALLAAVEEAGPVCGTPDRVAHPGLLTGLAGVGHGLLRAGFPDQVPPALLLRPAVRASAAPGPAGGGAVPALRGSP